MISRVSAGSSSSSRDLIGLTFSVSTAGSSMSATTNPVEGLGPSGNSTPLAPNRTASRSDSGIAYVNVPCTATGSAISANEESPCATLPSVDRCGDDHRARDDDVRDDLADRHPHARLVHVAHLVRVGILTVARNLSSGEDDPPVAAHPAHACDGVIELEIRKLVTNVDRALFECGDVEQILRDRVSVRVDDRDRVRQWLPRSLDDVQTIALRCVIESDALRDRGLSVADREASRNRVERRCDGARARLRLDARERSDGAEDRLVGTDADGEASRNRVE